MLVKIKKTFNDAHFAVRIIKENIIVQYFSTRLRNLTVSNGYIEINTNLIGCAYTIVSPNCKKQLLSGILKKDSEDEQSQQ